MHVAIIMNGTGRWATRRGLAPTAGCAAGITALRNTVALAVEAGVTTLTVYALCTADSNRSPQEMAADLRVLGGYLRHESQSCLAQSVRVSVIGNGERLHAPRPQISHHDEPASVRLHLRIVIDYSAHDGIVQSAWRSDEPRAWENFNQQLRELDRTALPAGAVDLLVRTGGGRCRSDFMLWEVAYAKLHYVDSLWPDFSRQDFQSALACHTACPVGHSEPAVRIA